MKRAIIMVLDSVGIGAQPDAGLYGDEGSNTLGHIHRELKNEAWFSLSNLERLGLGHIDGVDYLDRSHPPMGSFARMMEMSKGKDTTTGHWEIAGIILDKPFRYTRKGSRQKSWRLLRRPSGEERLAIIPRRGPGSLRI